MARARKTITLDEKIEKAQDAVEKTKADTMLPSKNFVLCWKRKMHRGSRNC